MIASVRARVRSWLFAPESDDWVTALRSGMGMQTVLYCAALWPDWNSIFSSTWKGLVSRELAEKIVASESPLIPRLGWVLDTTGAMGWSESVTLVAIYWLLALAGVCLLLGFFCRTAAITAWLVHLAAAKSAGLLSYGVDNLTTIGLFYLMLVPLPDRFSVDRKFWKRAPLDPVWCGFFRRVLQLHLCLIYFFGGLTKALGSGWWDGSNLWRALTRPPFDLLNAELIAKFDWVLPALGISICVIELAYPLIIWCSRMRRRWLLAVCGMHLAIGFTMGMYLFALVMIVLNVAAFGPTAPALAASHSARPQTV